jgi:hypothetical protein
MREHLDGTFAYQAVIRIKKKGKIVYRESEVFSKRHLAVNWAKRREVALQGQVGTRTAPARGEGGCAQQRRARCADQGPRWSTV